MSNDFVPNRDADLMVFSSSLAAHVVADPNAYGLVAGDATQIKDAADDYAAKLNLASDKATRGVGSIIHKNQAREILVAILRGYARRIKANDAVDDALKAELGLQLGDPQRTPVPAPVTRPQINIASVTLRQHQLRFVDSTTPEQRSKPQGVQGLQLFWEVGESGAAELPDPRSCRYFTFLTRLALTMDFTTADAGKTAYYYARWQTASGLTGPWSQRMSMPIVG